MNIMTIAVERSLPQILKIIHKPRTGPNWGVRSGNLQLFPGSANRIQSGKRSSRILVVQSVSHDYLVEVSTSSTPSFIGGPQPERSIFKTSGLTISFVPLTPALVLEFAKLHLTWALPGAIGSRKPSFGWGNRTPFSTQVVLATDVLFSDGHRFNRVIAQNSIRENQILERMQGFAIVMADATLAKIKMGYKGLTGSDADHLKTFAEIDDAIAAGFTGYTIDPSLVLRQTPGVVVRGIERSEEELAGDPSLRTLFATAVKRNRIDDDFLHRSQAFLQNEFAWAGSRDSETDLRRIKAVAIKFADSWSFMRSAYGRIRSALGAVEFDFEASFDETAQPTSYLAHLLTANELSRSAVKLTRFAVKYIGRFEKTTPWIPPAGKSVSAFARNYQSHQKIAARFGYLQSIHSGSGKYNIYPYCAGAHLKTSGDISRPIILALTDCNFDAFCYRFHEMIDSATDTKKLYGAVSSPQNDFPSLHKSDPRKLGRKEILRRLEHDRLWRTFSHYAYGMLQRASGTFNELLFEHRDQCAVHVAKVVNAHRSPLYRANGFKTDRRKSKLETVSLI